MKGASKVEINLANSQATMPKPNLPQTPSKHILIVGADFYSFLKDVWV